MNKLNPPFLPKIKQVFSKQVGFLLMYFKIFIKRELIYMVALLTFLLQLGFIFSEDLFHSSTDQA